MQETQVRSLSQEDPLEKEMATHSSILALRIHGQRSLVGYSPQGHKESDTTEWLHFHVVDLISAVQLSASAIHIYPLPLWLSQDTEYTSIYYTVGTCLSIKLLS